MKPNKELYSISELSALGYGSRSTIMQHIAIGDFGKTNPGGKKWLIRKSEYDEWLRERTERRHYKCW